MTAPNNPGDARPGIVDANENVERENTKTNADNGDRWLVKTPWTMSVLRSSDGSFPDVTPEGTVMSAEERAHAKAAAKAIWVKLTTSKVEGDN